MVPPLNETADTACWRRLLTEHSSITRRRRRRRREGITCARAGVGASSFRFFSSLFSLLVRVSSTVFPRTSCMASLYLPRPVHSHLSGTEDILKKIHAMLGAGSATERYIFPRGAAEQLCEQTHKIGSDRSCCGRFSDAISKFEKRLPGAKVLSDCSQKN